MNKNTHTPNDTPKCFRFNLKCGFSTALQYTIRVSIWCSDGASVPILTITLTLDYEFSFPKNLIYNQKVVGSVGSVGSRG